MKKPFTLPALFLLFICSFSLISCLDDDDGSKDKVSVIRITVDSEIVERIHYPFGSSGKMLSDFMKVKINNSNEWEYMSLFEIGDFKYEDGNEYLLEVEKTELANPPADGSSVVYKLRKIIKKTKINEDIHAVERYYMAEYTLYISGENLTDAEKEEIKTKIEAGLREYGTYYSYKFIYTHADKSRGHVVIYTGEEKEEGVFQRSTKDQELTKFDVQAGGKMRKFLTNFPVTRLISPPEYSFYEDVTETYKPDYPNLEQARISQRISYTY